MSYEMESEDFVRMKDAHIAALEEELTRERLRRESAEAEAELCFQTAQRTTKENLELRKQLQSWADEADKEIALAKAKQIEREALEL